MRGMNSTPPLPTSPTGEIHAPSLGMLLTMVRAEMVRAIEAELASQGLDISFTQYLIMKKAQQLGPASATELARAVEIDGGAMTRQLDQLERKGFLRRTPHAQDRRALRIELTDAGQAVWKNTASVCSQRVIAASQRSLDRARANPIARLPGARACGAPRQELTHFSGCPPMRLQLLTLSAALTLALAGCASSGGLHPDGTPVDPSSLQGRSQPVRCRCRRRRLARQ